MGAAWGGARARGGDGGFKNSGKRENGKDKRGKNKIKEIEVEVEVEEEALFKGNGKKVEKIRKKCTDYPRDLLLRKKPGHGRRHADDDDDDDDDDDADSA
ncbi:hypothetical protein M0804_006486 [Polistes exclamans]|nr:hypothetical protein M0804_006486 [Polistes exclamans]